MCVGERDSVWVTERGGGRESVSVSTQVSRTRSKVEFHYIIVNTFHYMFVSHSHSEDFYFNKMCPRVPRTSLQILQVQKYSFAI